MISGEMADFGGTSNIENKQILNAAGKFENVSGGVDYTVNIELDYVNGTISERSSGTDSTVYTFSPLAVNNKGDLKLVAYNNSNVVYTLTDVKVSYDTAAPVKYEYEASGDIASSKKQYRDLEGDAADTYAADIDYSEYFVKDLKWVVTNNEDKTAEISLTDTPAISSSGSVSFGLILYGGAEMLDKVKSVELKTE